MKLFCILYSKEKLYINTEMLWQLIEKRDIEGAADWSERKIYETIQGENQIYY